MFNNTSSYIVVLKSFMKKRLITKSNEMMTGLLKDIMLLDHMIEQADINLEQATE